MRSLRDAAAAFGFLTVLPLGRTWDTSESPDMLPWFPLVGWFLGVAALALLVALEALGVAFVRSAWLAGVGVVALWAGLTRFMHWDGLADTADGLLGAHERERRLEVMRDTQVGAFGAVAIVLIALAQVGAIGALVSTGAWWPLLAAPVLARGAVVLAAWSIPPAREEGLGHALVVERASLAARLVPAVLLLLLVVPLAIEYAYGDAGWSLLEIVVVLVAGDLAAVCLPRLLARPLGGTTGDLHGATVLLVETVVLVGAALAA